MSPIFAGKTAIVTEVYVVSKSGAVSPSKNATLEATARSLAALL